MNRVSGKLAIATFVGTLLFIQVSIASDAPSLKMLTEHEDRASEIKSSESEVVKGPYDEYGRTTPRSTVIGIANALRDDDYETAVQYLDLRNLPFTVSEQDGPELARMLKIIAVRTMLIDYEELSADPGGHSDDGLPVYRDRVTTIKTRDGPIDILLQRVPRGDGVFIWKISNATIAHIQRLNEEFGFGVLGDKLSRVFPHYTISGFELWQIAMLLVLLGLSYLAAYVVIWLLLRIQQRSGSGNTDRLRKFIAGPLRFLLMVLIFRSTFDTIAPSLTARAIFEARTFLIVAITWISIGLVDLLLVKLAERIRRNGQVDAVVLLKPASTALKLSLLFIGIVSWLDNLGYEVSTLIAGLGIGGVAVAFAAQRSIENLIGSVTIYASQPVHVGDFCRFGEIIGTVEEIGLRATTLRTLERSVVSIPNAKFSTDIIENMTQRDKILYRCRLRLSYNTTAQQMRTLLEKIREMIHTHASIDEETSRVRFVEFASYAQELELFIYLKTSDYAQYLEYREDINLRLLDLVGEAGAELAIPSNKTYFESLAPLADS